MALNGEGAGFGEAWKFELNRFVTWAGPTKDEWVAAVVLESCLEATSQTEAPHPGPLNSKARRIVADIYAKQHTRSANITGL